MTERGAPPVYSPPELISWRNSLTAFDCGDDAMNRWLREHALENEGRVSRTYVVTDAGKSVIAYYTLSTGRIDRPDMPRKLRQNLPEFVPVLVLGRLAVDRNHANIGLGGALLRQAMMRALEASRNIGIRALLVHAIDDAAEPFYLQYGFVRSPTAGRSLILPIETIEEALPR